mmetsp:Transcript_57835/g.161432  ORF Transcript_57835/g.161432 Transcript_57835/m.161432 type:complete len:219 (-) Transcript_57835:406-1062(-)
MCQRMFSFKCAGPACTSTAAKCPLSLNDSSKRSSRRCRSKSLVPFAFKASRPSSIARQQSLFTSRKASRNAKSRGGQRWQGAVLYLRGTKTSKLLPQPCTPCQSAFNRNGSFSENWKSNSAQCPGAKGASRSFFQLSGGVLESSFGHAKFLAKGPDGSSRMYAASSSQRGVVKNTSGAFSSGIPTPYIKGHSGSKCSKTTGACAGRGKWAFADPAVSA